MLPIGAGYNVILLCSILLTITLSTQSQNKIGQ